MNRLTEAALQLPSPTFSQTEVSALVGGSTFSRHGLVKRALANDEILCIRRGLYALAPRYRHNPLNVFALAEHIYGPSYVSMESALCHHGWIPEAVPTCTCASYGNAKTFETPLGAFVYRRVPQRCFFAGVSRVQDADGQVYIMASPAKALADYTYVHKRDWKGIHEAAASLRIDDEDWQAVAPEDLRELLENYTSRRVRRLLVSWREALGR